MARIIKDRVLELSTSVGTGAFTLVGAIIGYQPFSTVCVNGDTFTYFIEGVSAGVLTGEWECGLGTWGTGNILTRNTVYTSSNAGALVNFSAGQKRVVLAILAHDLDVILPVNPVIVSSTAVTAVSGGTYILNNVADTVVTLPSTPSTGDKVVIIPGNGLTTNSVNGNGQTIMGISENMTLDNSYISVTLQFLNNTWRII